MGGSATETGRAWTRPQRRERARKALPGDARRHNRELLLGVLFRSGPLSRADLARETHLTRVTASDLVGELLAEGIVEELGQRTDGRVGKPATLVGIVRDAAVVVSLDLSDDEVFRGALVDLAGHVQERRSVARDGRTGAAAVDLVVGLASDLANAAGRPLLGCGIGSPGVVGPDGVVIEAPNLGWSQVDLPTAVSTALGCPVHVLNDANAAALGELAYGEGHDRDLLLVKVGHGVGAGLVIDGHLVHGTRFAAGEIGHVVVDERGAPCVCGNRGCLETVLAVPALRRATSHTVAARRLGAALAPVVSALNLREVALSGPADLLDDAFRATALEALRKRVMSAVGDLVEIRLSSLAEDDVLLGATVPVLDRELGIA